MGVRSCGLQAASGVGKRQEAAVGYFRVVVCAATRGRYGRVRLRHLPGVSTVSSCQLGSNAAHENGGGADAVSGVRAIPSSKTKAALLTAKDLKQQDYNSNRSVKTSTLSAPRLACARLHIAAPNLLQVVK